MNDWIVIVTEGQQLYGVKAYGPFVSEEVAQALARGFTNMNATGVGTAKQAQAVRMEKP